MYCLDRFEGNYAIIEFEDENGSISYIKADRSDISDEVREGDALAIENGIYTTDRALTEQRRAAIHEKLKKLINRGR